MEENQEQDEWVSESQAARTLGISQSTISGYIKQGKLEKKKSKRDTRLVLVNLKELRALLRDDVVE